MQNLDVALVQGKTRWHDPAANRAHYGSLLREQAVGSDLVVLPETFLSGFTNAVEEQAESMSGEGMAWMREMAAELGAVVTGSLVIGEAGRVYNRLVWMRPDGRFEHYDKRHLFRMADEHHRYAAGSGQLLVELNGWRIRPLVCYDLRFPVWCRNRRNEQATGGMEYDLSLFVANWPAPRRTAWRTLLRARAIENLAYCIGVNRVGSDGNGIDYAGDSGAFEPRGEALVELADKVDVARVTLDGDGLLAYREKFPAWMDADNFQLEP